MGKILFIRGGAVGDFVLTMPAIRLVREALPNNEIEVLGYPSITALALAAGIADRTRALEDARLALFFVPGASLDSDWCAYFASFDVVVSYLYDPDDHFSNNLRVAGVRTLLRGPFRPREDVTLGSAAMQLAAPLAQLAIFPDKLDVPFTYTKGSKRSLEIAARTWVLHPGSGSPGKNWPRNRWIDLLTAISVQDALIHWVITGGEAETDWLALFLDELRSRRIPYQHPAGATLPELGQLFGQIEFYLGHDTGISHLAASTGARGCILFGPTNPKIWAPPSQQMEVIASPTGTMDGISVTDVWSQVRSLHFPTA
jgi:heptosyltransferase III